MTPESIIIDTYVTKIVADGRHGSFGLKPLHIDYAAALNPGILLYYTLDGEENIMAVDEGVLVKCGDEVLISTMQAIEGTDLNKLEEEIRSNSRSREEKENATHRALRRLEADLMWHLLELEKSSGMPGLN